MKVAISLPDELGRKTTSAARRRKVSRSALIQAALRAYLGGDDDLTARIDAALQRLGDDPERPVGATAAAWQELEW